MGRKLLSPPKFEGSGTHSTSPPDSARPSRSFLPASSRLSRVPTAATRRAAGAKNRLPHWSLLFFWGGLGGPHLSLFFFGGGWGLCVCVCVFSGWTLLGARLGMRHGVTFPKGANSWVHSHIAYLAWFLLGHILRSFAHCGLVVEIQIHLAAEI